MTNQNSAAQAADPDFVTTELRGIIDVCEGSPTAVVSVERMRLWLSKLRAPVDDERVPHHDQPQQTGVGEWCAPGPAAEQRRAWLLRFADTERGDCVYYDEQEARRAFAQAEGRGWNCYLFEYARRAAHASAPVADELPHWEEVSAKLERDETLTPLEFFIYENEPAGGDADAWRDQLAAALVKAPAAGGA